MRKNALAVLVVCLTTMVGAPAIASAKPHHVHRQPVKAHGAAIATDIAGAFAAKLALTALAT